MRLIKSRLVMFLLMLAVASTAAAASPARSRSAKRVNRSTSTTVSNPSTTANTPKIKAPVTRQISTESDGSSCSWLYYQCSWGISDTACTKLAICNVKNATGNGGVYAE
ncbi:MAG TPA: hypothetical protein VGF69_02345 [Thermoanaerobaculia bacterium]|jgi:hypothetical protein